MDKKMFVDSMYHYCRMLSLPFRAVIAVVCMDSLLPLIQLHKVAVVLLFICSFAFVMVPFFAIIKDAAQEAWS